MDLIKEAIRKAKASSPKSEAPERSSRPLPVLGGDPIPTAPAAPGWTPPEAHPDAGKLERNRIVSFARDDPTHVAFNLLRTKIYRTLMDNRWRSLAITSPTVGCGKTMVAINLALSLARQPGCKTALIDLDLKKSGVARTIGINAEKSIGQYLEGAAAFESCFVRIGESLILGLNNHRVENPAELMYDQRLKDMLRRVTDSLAPDFVLFDLPPMLSSDEAMAFLPQVDASLLVVAARQTTAPQIEECERHLRENAGYLGVVLNKTADVSEKYYYQSDTPR